MGTCNTGTLFLANASSTKLSFADGTKAIPLAFHRAPSVYVSLIGLTTVWCKMIVQGFPTVYHGILAQILILKQHRIFKISYFPKISLIL